MRIPLDYYRILGLPLAASDEQLRQAYSDRIVQLPRREYSQAAIASRKQLIEEAYVVLSNPKERSSYDQLYLSHAYDPENPATSKVAVENRGDSANGHFDVQSLSVEISSEELVGALLILQELGEYELVLKLGRNYLGNQNGAVSGRNGYHRSAEELADSSDRPDIILTVALACLELGREQWQQGYYENAAVSLETGQEMLYNEGIFPTVQAEIQADLYKLRPYRILELLALPQEKTIERRQGLDLLQSILDDRGGIDGTGNDQSGLNIDDFLRFIQQIRHYLTVAEQHKLFDAESKRPSAVATYLAVYASVARGFTQRQPALIRQAKQMLMRLSKRQDVHLEQSLCALLLGQTEEATRALELSQEYEALALIREKSQDSPDLLPGLCLYAEQWLQNEVFPHFRDLSRQQASLKDYFANPQVQAYLEALPNDAETTNEWSVINRQSFSQPNSPGRTPANRPATPLPNPSGTNRQFPQNRTPDPELPETPYNKRPEPIPFTAARENLPPQPAYTGYPPEIPGEYARPPQQPSGYNQAPPRQTTKRRRRKKPKEVVNRGHSIHQRQSSGSNINRQARLLWIALASLGGIVVFWLIVSTTFGLLKNAFFPSPTIKGEPLSIQINQPPIEIPDKNAQIKTLDGLLTEETAQQVVEKWLSTKATALGSEHKIDSLNEILTGSSLSQWRLIAQQEQAGDRYREYAHSVKIDSVITSNTEPNRATVGATVREITQFYENGRKKKSSDESLRVRYELIRQDNVWRIQKMSAAIN
ncbi:IMS domain-containing protein [Nostoc sp. MS1]|uniref:IMS domain-containing protein n=1 Tax=Nostoc sp. MS1 TaxID=2764711 RepID=UPI001CC7BD98|nr:IMS domain-containing protein [Nostoc sp. MS1]BCL35384.1 cell division protein Ftn2 [Nostoc sp. MS1]